MSTGAKDQAEAGKKRWVESKMEDTGWQWHRGSGSGSADSLDKEPIDFESIPVPQASGEEGRLSVQDCTWAWSQLLEDCDSLRDGHPERSDDVSQRQNKGLGDENSDLEDQSGFRDFPPSNVTRYGNSESVIILQPGGWRCALGS